MNESINATLDGAISLYKSTESIAQSGNMRTMRVSVSVPQQQLQEMLTFLLANGFSPDKAIELIKASQQRVLNANDSSDTDARLFIFVIMLVFVHFGLIHMRNDIPAWTLLLSVPVAFVLMGWLLFKGLVTPAARARAYFKSRGVIAGTSLAPHLNELCAVQERSAFAHLKEHHFKGLAIFVIIAVVVIGGIAGYFGISTLTVSDYHSQITAGGDPLTFTSSTGALYAVYDEDQDKYVPRYLSSDRMAQSTPDVLGVLSLSTGRSKDCTYENGAVGYRRTVTIELYDCSTGEVVASTTVRGGKTPNTIKSTTSLLSGNEIYGSHPSQEDVASACEALILDFEEERSKPAGINDLGSFFNK